MLPGHGTTEGIPAIWRCDIWSALQTKKDYSATNTAFLEEWQFPGVVVQFRCKEDGQLSVCGCAWAAHSPHFGRLAREVCLSCVQAAPMGKVSQSPCLGREDMFAPAVTPPCGSPAKLAQASREQDTTDTIFDPPAFTLTCCSSQAVPMKFFFVYSHCISTPVPESFLSLQWGFG